MTLAIRLINIVVIGIKGLTIAAGTLIAGWLALNLAYWWLIDAPTNYPLDHEFFVILCASGATVAGAGLAFFLLVGWMFKKF